MKVAILGSEGFVGSELCKVLKTHYEVCGVTRRNYGEKCDEEFDVLINANGNSRRYWANKNILEDFQASTISVYESIFDFNTQLYIYISSVDVYEKHDSPISTEEKTCINPSGLCAYGFHKYLSELIVRRHCPRYLILRCSAMVGERMRKGPVRDLLDGKPLFITSDSMLQFIGTSEVAKIILSLINQNIYNETVNIGGIGTISLEYLASLGRTKLSILPEAQRQIYEMNVSKLRKIFPIKTSKTYVQESLNRLGGKR